MNRGYVQPLKKVSGKLLPDQTVGDSAQVDSINRVGCVAVLGSQRRAIGASVASCQTRGFRGSRYYTRFYTVCIFALRGEVTTTAGFQALTHSLTHILL